MLIYCLFLLVSYLDKLACSHFQSSRQLFFVSMWPASEDSLSHGTEVAGLIRYLQARTDSCGCVPARLDRHCSVQSVSLMAVSALYKFRVLLHRASSSESESEYNEEKWSLFVFAGSIVVASLHYSCSRVSKLVQTSSHSSLARHFNSLKCGLSTVAILSHWLVQCSYHVVWVIIGDLYGMMQVAESR